MNFQFIVLYCILESMHPFRPSFLICILLSLYHIFWAKSVVILKPFTKLAFILGEEVHL